MHNISDPSLYGVIGSMAISTKMLALKFSYIIVVVVGTLGVVRFYMGLDSTLQLKKYVLIPLLIVVTIRYYPVVIDYSGYVTSKFIGHMGGNTSFETLNQRFATIQKLMAPKDVEEEDADDDEDGWLTDIGEAIMGAIATLWDWFIYFFESLGRTIQTMLIWVVRMVIEKIRNLVLGFLIITGPIALMLELVPAFRGVFLEWFKNYLNVIFWAATLAVLDNIIYSYALAHAKMVASAAVEHTGQAEGVMEWGGRFVNNLVIVMMYLLTPTLTTFYIGNSASSGIMSRMVGFVTAGVMSAKMFKMKKKG